MIAWWWLLVGFGLQFLVLLAVIGAVTVEVGWRKARKANKMMQPNVADPTKPYIVGKDGK